MKARPSFLIPLFALAVALIALPCTGRGEAMLQYFNTSWNDIAAKMPELAEAGYTSLWLPPPTKGSGGLSVGYDLWDRFDLGSKDQRGTVRTLYGTEAELLRLVETAHRFGIRVYFDYITNHNAFDIPGYDASTPIDIYPGFLPEDFHLRLTQSGFYRKWDNTRNWGDAWQVQQLGLADLIDIAQEPGATNLNFGLSEGGTIPKLKFVRHPNNPEYYCFHWSGAYVGFGPGNGLTVQNLADHADFYGEYVEDSLNRAGRWIVDRTKADGFRLDAVKHVRADFYGASGSGADTSDYGFTGQTQRQFNLTRGFSDANHRDSAFDTEKGRDDLLMFGEHLGEPPGYGDFIDRGMRLVDNPLRNEFNDRLGNPSSGLQGFDQPGAGGFAPNAGVMHAQSHDSDYAARRELQHAMYLTRAGIGLIYTDGNNQAEVLAGTGGSFPRHANTNFLGQYGDNRIPNLLYIHNHFARGYQVGRFSDGDAVVYERIDKRENGSMTDADGVAMLFMLNDNYANGVARSFATSFPAVKFGSDSYLFNYSSYGGGFYTWASDLYSVVVPPGGYFVFSWRSPEESDIWKAGGGQSITILQDGQPLGTMSYIRKDGRDGDPNYAYSATIPRVTSGSNLSFFARADGSAENILLSLDGGIDVNSQIPLGPTTGEKRDNAPAVSTDVFVGFEQMLFDHRQYAEKFAAVDTTRSQIGSAGAETYRKMIGTAGFVIVNGPAGANSTYDTQGGNQASFVYHDPAAGFGSWGGSPGQALQYDEGGANVVIFGKSNNVGVGYAMYLYYTTDGTNPEGAGGVGSGTTKAVAMTYQAPNDDGGTTNWWKGTISPKPSGQLRYKLGIYRHTSAGNAVASVFPSGPDPVAQKKKMLTVFKIPSFNATTALVYPHNDYAATQTGLTEGFHWLRARAFLNRAGRASIYNTFTQTFYYDVATPGGEIKFPATNGETLTGQSYGAVVRGDPTITEAWMHIDDADATNDDVATGVANGNGIGFEPFTDANGNGVRESGEAFIDLNGNGVWDTNVPAWVRVSEGSPSTGISSAFPREWRFNYRNIPASGAATIKVRLRELSSSAAFFNAGNVDTSDSAGHFKTLTRTVTAAGDPQRLFIAFPQGDGQTVGAGYVMKARMSQTISNGVDDATLKSRFVVQIASSESGSVSNPVTQSAASFQIIRNAAPGFDDLAFTLPGLYNGQPDFLHSLLVTLTRPGNSALAAARQVKATQTGQGTYVNIVTPPEFDSDGKRYVISLPDVAAPTSEQRQTPVQVETSLDVQTVMISFLSGSGTVTLTPSTETAIRGFVSVVNGSANVSGAEKQLAGTVSINNGATAMTGAGTSFTTVLAVGDVIRVGTATFTVAVISSNTALTVTSAATGPALNANAYVQPAFTRTFHGGDTIKIAGVTYRVAQVPSASSLVLGSVFTGATAGGLTAYRVDGNPVVVGSKKSWNFLWTNMTLGEFTFAATGHPAAGADVVAVRNASVIFEQIVASDPNDVDDDDDGLSDTLELTITPLPTTNAEGWLNADIHLWSISGHTDPRKPDSDNDGLPDGLESGWGSAQPGTNTATDTNGDGEPNFISDTDPPIFNTNDNATRPAGYENYNPWTYDHNRSRTDLIAGTMTNPNKADTDDDGLKDGIEDANHNGRVEVGTLDGGGALTALVAHPVTIYNTSRIDRTKLPAGGIFLETDPNGADTDGDGVSDGGEDANGNGRADIAIIDRNQPSGASFVILKALDETTTGPLPWKYSDFCHSLGAYKSRRIKMAALDAVFRPGGMPRSDGYDVIWLETDPRNGDSDGDGLPDGWEIAHGLDPLDDGIAGHYSLRTGKPANPNNGAAGDPDNDSFTNLQEYVNNTDPQTPNNAAPPPPGSIVIGPGATTTVGGVVNAHEFTDWTANDLIVLDEYDGAGPNNQGGDVYHANDGFDSSRDLTAFYAHDGGDTAMGGDGNFYFRVDLRDLRPFAEEGSLDIYVAINFGNPGTGEKNLPDDVDTLTTMGWQAVVACYSTNNGRVYVDTNPGSNSTAIGQNLTPFGVVPRDQNAADGFKKAYFNSDLDSVEFSVSRKALRDAGWNGLDAGDLIYQVFTTKDGTGNTPPGAGDLGGRTDIRDTIYDDFLASDYYSDQASISGSNSVLRGYFGVKAGNDRGRRVKVISLAHGSQAIVPGSTVQALISDGAGAGYYRPLDAHQAFGVPLTLHITPTLASAMQWAASANPAKDGPAFNARVKTLAQSGVIGLLGSTFADHIVGYFPNDFNAANVALANQYLGSIYGGGQSAKVFWNPERVADTGTLSKISALGFEYTFIDQMRHVFRWFGRQSALGSDGYRINTVNGVKCFVINDQISAERFATNDNGPSFALRDLLLTKARDGQQDQVVVLMSAWEDFTNKANADAYDKNIRWMASHPWVQLVTPDQIANGQVDLSRPPDGLGDAFGTVSRGTNPSLAKVQHDFLDHATQGSYDNWYNGSALEESLAAKRFDIRTGVQLPAGKNFGLLTAGTGLVSETWSAITSMTSATSDLALLARGTAGAAGFETAFHNQTNNDLSKYSTGDYIYPDTSFQSLAGFAKVAQSQFRFAAQYKRVETWAAAANAGAYSATAATEPADVDGDGENEYLLYNDRVFAVFERIGGRLTGAWVRDLATGGVLQTIGNPLSYAGSETEHEGNANITGGAVGAHRTSGFKDWFATGATDALAYVNNLYTAAAAPSGAGWTFTSSDGKIAKTITLAPGATLLRASYALGAGVGPLYVRFGLSPNLSDLLLNGQANLSPLVNNTTAGEVGVTNFKTGGAVRAFVRYGGAGNAASFNAGAVDRDSGVTFDTLNMRNQAQTQQIEIFGGNGLTFDLGLQTGATITQDTDGDGLPDWWETANGLDPFSALGVNGADGDGDGDGLANFAEYRFGTNPAIADSTLVQVTINSPTAGTCALAFATRADRTYRISFTNDLSQPFLPLTPDLPGTGGVRTWTDDGSQTGTAPPAATQRYYKVEARLPQSE